MRHRNLPLRLARLLRAESNYLRLVICLLVASSNLFLVNNVAALRNSAGENLVGIRDVLMALVIIKGLHWRDGRLAGPWSSPYAILCLCVAVLTPLAAVVGLFSGGQTIDVAREGVTMSGWCLPLAIAPNLKSERALTTLANTVVVLSVLISLAVFFEAFTGMSVRIVTPVPIEAASIRSTPSCWPLMMLGASILLVRVGRKGGRGKELQALLWSVVVVASLLTQSRTLLVGLCVSTAAYLLLSPKRTIAGPWIVGLLAVVPITAPVVMAIGSTFIRYDFESYFTARYGVLSGVDSAVEYSEQDTRRLESDMAIPAFLNSPLVGVGLGAPYRDAIFVRGVPLSEQHEDPSLLAHNIYVHFAVKYGLPGLLVYLIFNCVVFRSVYRAARIRLPIGGVGLGFSVGLVNLLACAWFGNVFGQTYMVQAAMIVLAGLIACERMGRTELVQTTARVRCPPSISARGFAPESVAGTLA
jgi:O-antigen ligase